MDVNMYYCFFMLTCFGSQKTGVIPQLSCPSKCQCYYASSDGVSGNSEAESFKCDGSGFLSSTLFSPKQINTFVLTNGSFRSSDYIRVRKPYQSISVVLQEFQTQSSLSNQPSVFSLFDSQSLKYLTVISTITSSSFSSSFEWSLLTSFKELEAIYIENSANVQSLDESFSSLKLDKLHTLVIKSSSLNQIDHESLVSKSKLRTLILSENALHNWVWLCSLQQPLSELWHLDLSSNHLTLIPPCLIKILPKLRVFHLEHNRLRYFSYETMLPWFNIDEFQPSLKSSTSQSSSKDAYNYIFYTEDVAKILKTTQFEAEYIEDSFFNQVHFICKEGSVNNWQDLINYCHNYWNYFPDNLRIDSTKLGVKLEAFLENGDVMPTNVFIKGEDFNEKFYFDSTIDLTTYRQNYRLLMNHFDLISQHNGHNAIRLSLFSTPMLDYFFGKQTITKEQIALIIDLIIEVLDEAAERKLFVMLIMWKHSHVKQRLSTTQYDENFAKTFKENVLTPLLQQIARHSALIGIEVMHQFLSKEFDPSTLVDPANLCVASQLSGFPEIPFMGKCAQMTKETMTVIGADKLVGLSVDADCQHCFKIAFMEACRRIALFTATNGFDFVTLVNNGNSVQSDHYSYHNFYTNEPVWFHKVDDDQPSGVKYRGVFHVVEATVAQLDSNFDANIQTASGYFLVS